MSLDDKENVADVHALRLELKRWEKEFVDSHDGRKPSREEIKRYPEIGAKYKLYNKLQQKGQEPARLETPRKVRRKDVTKPTEQSKTFASTPKRTPSKRRQDESSVTVGRSPVPPVEATPAFIRRALGPTPQKDGQVLGIFDIALSATPARAKDSPSKARSQPLNRTPSKPGSMNNELMLTRTPQSSSRRFLFDAFAGTPLKRKSDEADLENIDIGSATKRRFATPSFLRRSFPLASISENASGPETTSAAPFKRRSFVRSLSSIIQGLRQQEEERMDEELEMLNEMEDEAMGIVRPKKTPAAPAAAAAVLVEDSQAVEMPLGPDKAGGSSDESSDEEATGGFIRKPWKKKGLKRQTRRVIMRPVTHKAPKAGSGDALLTIDEDDGEEAVQETQLPDSHAAAEGDDGETSHGKGDDTVTKSTDDNGKKAKAKKMISAQANANFRRLNIKNKNSKAKGKGGRFGRRK